MTSCPREARSGVRVFLQCENFQRGGAFEFRGAYHDAIARLMSSPPSRMVATVSSRTHVGKDLRWPVVFREPPRMS
jgi:threonine dehydratase